MSSSLSPSKSKSVVERRVYVTGYSLKETLEEMKQIFEKYGTIEEFSWKGRFFFVAYKTSEDATNAVTNMNKSDINGHTLLVEFARAKKKNGACYNCGKLGHFARNCRYRGRSSSSSSDSERRRRKKKKRHRRRSTSSDSSSESRSRKRKKKSKTRKRHSSSGSKSKSSS